MRRRSSPGSRSGVASTALRRLPAGGGQEPQAGDRRCGREPPSPHGAGPLARSRRSPPHPAGRAGRFAPGPARAQRKCLERRGGGNFQRPRAGRAARNGCSAEGRRRGVVGAGLDAATDEEAGRSRMPVPRACKKGPCFVLDGRMTATGACWAGGGIAIDRSPRREPEDLVARVALGDRDAFADLYGAYTEPVTHLCRRLLGSDEDAKDARSEVFLKAREAIASYDRRVPFAAGCSPLPRTTASICCDGERSRAVCSSPPILRRTRCRRPARRRSAARCCASDATSSSSRSTAAAAPPRAARAALLRRAALRGIAELLGVRPGTSACCCSVPSCACARRSRGGGLG